MKAAVKSDLFPVLAGGVLCTLLRFFLYAYCFDGWNLVDAYHPLHLLCLCIALGVFAFVMRTARKGTPRALPLSPKWNLLLTAAAALCFLGNAFALLRLATDRLSTIWVLLSLASAPCILVYGWLQNKGKRPHFLLQSVLCLAFAVNLICRYRPWSGNPQLADYVFQVLACAVLTLSAYYRMAVAAKMGSEKVLYVCRRMAVFFCIPSLVGSGATLFYLGGILWALTQDSPAPQAEITEEN